MTEPHNISDTYSSVYQGLGNVQVDVGIVHLVRAQNGIEPFRRFLDSHLLCPGGIPHDLLVVYKGFDTPDGERLYAEAETLRKAHLARLPQICGRSIGSDTLRIRDYGLDINAYDAAARHFERRYLCFLNSYTELCDEYWLRKLTTHIISPGVGVVGATTSWETFVPPLAAERARLDRRDLFSRTRGYLRLTYQRLRFPAFPNPHVRTNGFILARANLLQLRGTRPRTKWGAWNFENGRGNMTQQLMRRGLRPLLVGRDGIGYEIADWPHTNTFRQGNQSNLLMIDNRTRDFANGTPEERRKLWEFAWQGAAIPPE